MIGKGVTAKHEGERNKRRLLNEKRLGEEIMNACAADTLTLCTPLLTKEIYRISYLEIIE